MERNLAAPDSKCESVATDGLDRVQRAEIGVAAPTPQQLGLPVFGPDRIDSRWRICLRPSCGSGSQRRYFRMANSKGVGLFKNRSVCPSAVVRSWLSRRGQHSKKAASPFFNAEIAAGTGRTGG